MKTIRAKTLKRPIPELREPGRAGRGVRGAQAAATRERILVAALELIAERGYAATSIEAVCQRAGVVRTAIYWHFGAKEGLVVPIISRVSGDWIAEIERSVYSAGDPLARLDAFVAGLRWIVAERSHLVRFLLAVSIERSEQDPATREALHAMFAGARDAIARGFDASLGGPIPESRVVARTALGFLSNAVSQRLLDPSPEALDEIFADLRTAILLMLGHRLPPQTHEGGNP